MYGDIENPHTGVLEDKYGEGAYAKQGNRFKPKTQLIVDIQLFDERLGDRRTPPTPSHVGGRVDCS